MKKFLTKSIRNSQRSFANVVPVTVPPLAAVLSDVKSAFFGLCVHAGKEVLSAMMEGDRVALCGPKGRPDSDRRAVRGGHTQSSLTLGGRRVAMRRPRVRSVAGEELSLASFGWADCQGQPKFPQLCKLNFPHPVHDSVVSSARTRPAFSFSLRRYELPRMLSVTA